MLSSATEHKAVLEPLEHLASLGFDVELLKPPKSGRFDAADVMSRVREDTLLVSLMHVNNETGVVQPVTELAAELHRTLTYFHVDAAQSYTRVEPEALMGPIDLISMSGHKIGAPMGVGALVVRRRGRERPPLKPLMHGGGQERGLRPGTLPVPLIAGLAEVVRERTELRSQWLAETLDFRRELLGLFDELDGTINGDIDHSSPQILNVSFAGVDSEAALVALRGVADVATGSACTSASYTPSHVLTAMDLDERTVSGALRFSWWGRPTTDLTEVKEALEFIRVPT